MVLQASLLAVSVFQAQNWVDPVERFSVVKGIGDFERRMGDSESAVFHDGDVLTFLVRSDKGDLQLTNMLRLNLKRVEGKNLFAAQARIPESDRLLMSYAFTEGGMVTDSLVDYRAKNAPEIPERVNELKGKFINHEFESKALGEKRTIEIYLPKTDRKNLPVVYLTDGQALKRYVAETEWLIDHKKIEPVVLVGLYNGRYRGDMAKGFDMELDFRAKEYLKAIGSDRYDMHMRFLAEEVMPYVESKYSVSSRREDRVLTGYSNGGAYVVTASVDRPELFGNVFAYSVAVFLNEDLEKAVKDKSLPRYSFAAGSLEPFIVGTRDAEKILRGAGADTRKVEYVAGHDPLLWRVALMDDLVRTFPFKKAEQ